MHEEQWIETNGIRLYVVFAGPKDGKPVVLLHGFPEFWYAWRQQVEPLAAAGYRVIVPDQRGYNLSDKPKGVKEYRVGLLAQDIVGLLDGLAYSEVALVGHDWGGVVAWQLATDYPGRLNHLVILDAPHQDSMRRAILHSPGQIVRSWYVYMFQLPWVAEHLFYPRFAGHGFDNAKPGSFTAEDMARYRAAWAQPGAVHATINWYRAAFRALFRPAAGAGGRPKGRQGRPAPAPIQVPTLILWGEADWSLSLWLARDSAARCTQSTLRVFPGDGHWLQHDKAQEVTQAILDFLDDTPVRPHSVAEIPPLSAHDEHSARS
jgi:pimeloyl-ACP methyl ester carboxylesterase